MTTLRKQSTAAAELREQLKRSLRVTGTDLANALSDIGRAVGVPVTFPDKENEPEYEVEAVDGTDSWDSGWFEDEGEDQ